MKKIIFLFSILSIILIPAISKADVSIIDNGNSSFTISGTGIDDYHRLYYYPTNRQNTEFGVQAVAGFNTDTATFTLNSYQSAINGEAYLFYSAINDDWCSQHTYLECNSSSHYTIKYVLNFISDGNGDGIYTLPSSEPEQDEIGIKLFGGVLPETGEPLTGEAGIGLVSNAIHSTLNTETLKILALLIGLGLALLITFKIRDMFSNTDTVNKK